MLEYDVGLYGAFLKTAFSARKNEHGVGDNLRCWEYAVGDMMSGRQNWGHGIGNMMLGLWCWEYDVGNVVFGV